MLSHADLLTLQQPPHITASDVVPEEIPEILLEKNLGASLFQLNRHDEMQPTLSGHLEKRNSTQSMPDPRKPRWLLKVEKPLVVGAAHMSNIAEAEVHMHEGRVHSARKTLLAVLQQDPHNVEAMAALAKLARELGESEAEQTYLQILRQEIPEYDVAYEPASEPAGQD
jgi:predicted Zn-dependent protease